LPAAIATGNLELRPFSVVHSLIYDEQKQRATGVKVIDANDKSSTEYYAKLIFLNAGTLNSTLVLLNSNSRRFPNGLGNDSGVLGHYLMDHNYRAHFGATFHGLTDKYYTGRRPTGVYIPRFRNVGSDVQRFLRGYAFAAGGSRRQGDVPQNAIGRDLKMAMQTPGNWDLWMTGMGECLPYFENRVRLSSHETDAWGIPQLSIDCEYKDNELAMLKDILETGGEMLENAGFKNVEAYDGSDAPGLGIHEMGTARMGRDPQSSILNAHNQVWSAKNVFITDGSCMTSNACQNPSLTYMALTARAVNFAVQELKRMEL
jgi:choline dehydrogenase-like flavoprotein